MKFIEITTEDGKTVLLATDTVDSILDDAGRAVIVTSLNVTYRLAGAGSYAAVLNKLTLAGLILN